MTDKQKLGLREQVLLAALTLTGGDLAKPFSAEDLLLQAWRGDPYAWGLRNHEKEHPDSERIYLAIERASVKGGLVGLGLFEKVQPRVYKLTASGLAKASAVGPVDPKVRERAARVIEDDVHQMLGHRAYLAWTETDKVPDKFRDAGHFWNIAAGTPADVVQARLQRVESTAAAALAILNDKKVDEVRKKGGKLYDRGDVVLLLQFQQALKHRFRAELRMMGAEVDDLPPKGSDESRRRESNP